MDEQDNNRIDEIMQEPQSKMETTPKPEPQPEMDPQQMTGEQPVWQDDTSPYSPLYNPNQGKKSKNYITLALICILVVLLVIGLIMAMSKLVQAAMIEAGQSSLNGRSFTSRMEEFVENFRDDIQEEEPYAAPSEDEIYMPSPEDEYYARLADSIRNDLSYTVKKENYSYEDQEKGVSIQITYPVISGEQVSNLDHINEYIEGAATYYMRSFANHPENGKVSSCEILVEGYVTYMSEDTLSVVLSESLSLTEIGQVDLFCINVDMPTGQILENTDILSYSEALAADFRKISNRQNGKAEIVDALSDEEMADYLSDPSAGIFFYTPVGVEIGYNYSMDSASGWITATIKDYEKYINKM